MVILKASSGVQVDSYENKQTNKQKIQSKTITKKQQKKILTRYKQG